jgi:hypothetical protein
MDLLTWLRKQLEEADPDLLRAMVNEFVAALMGAEVDAVCNASYNERTAERENLAQTVTARDGGTPELGRSSSASPSSGREATSPTGSWNRGGAPSRR